MRTNLTIQQLESFVKVADRRSFRAAAQALHVSQPALSRTIRVMEDQVGARLFDRDTRHVALTPAGEQLLLIARRMLDEFHGAFGELAGFLEGRSGHVKAVAIPSAGVTLLPAAIARFRVAHPQVEFTLMEAPAQRLLAIVDEGRADFGICVQPLPDRRIQYRHLFDDPFALICRRDDALASRKLANWSVFATRPFIASGIGSSIRNVTDAAFLHSGLQVPPAFTFPSVAAGGALVVAGLGISALPALALPFTQTDQLTAIKLGRPAMSRALGIVTRIGRSLSPVSRAFIETLCAHAADSAPRIGMRGD